MNRSSAQCVDTVYGDEMPLVYYDNTLSSDTKTWLLHSNAAILAMINGIPPLHVGVYKVWQNEDRVNFGRCERHGNLVKYYHVLTLTHPLPDPLTLVVRLRSKVVENVPVVNPFMTCQYTTESDIPDEVLRVLLRCGFQTQLMVTISGRVEIDGYRAEVVGTRFSKQLKVYKGIMAGAAARWSLVFAHVLVNNCFGYDTELLEDNLKKFADKERREYFAHGNVEGNNVPLARALLSEKPMARDVDLNATSKDVLYVDMA